MGHSNLLPKTAGAIACLLAVNGIGALRVAAESHEGVAAASNPQIVVIVDGPRIVAFDNTGDLNTALACDLLKTGGGTGPFNPEGVPSEVIGWNILSGSWPAACDAVGVFVDEPPWFGGGGGGGGGGEGGGGGGGLPPPPPGDVWSEDDLIRRCEIVFDPVNVDPGPLRDCVLANVREKCQGIGACYPAVPGGFDAGAPDYSCTDPIMQDIMDANVECFDEHVIGLIEGIFAPPDR